MQRLKEQNIVFVGPTGVGKTEVANRLSAAGSYFSDRYYASTGIDFYQSDYQGSNYIFTQKFWDTAGSKSCNNLVSSNSRVRADIVLFYDSSQPDGIEQLKAYLESLGDWLPEDRSNVRLYLVGTKSDDTVRVNSGVVAGFCEDYLYDKYKITIPEEHRFTTSAKENVGIEDLRSKTAKNRLALHDAASYLMSEDEALRKLGLKPKNTIKSFAAGAVGGTALGLALFGVAYGLSFIEGAKALTFILGLLLPQFIIPALALVGACALAYRSYKKNVAAVKESLNANCERLSTPNEGAQSAAEKVLGKDYYSDITNDFSSSTSTWKDFKTGYPSVAEAVRQRSKEIRSGKKQ